MKSRYTVCPVPASLPPPPSARLTALACMCVCAEQKYTEGRTPGERQDLLLALQSHELRRDALGLGISGHRTKPKGRTVGPAIEHVSIPCMPGRITIFKGCVVLYMCHGHVLARSHTKTMHANTTCRVCACAAVLERFFSRNTRCETGSGPSATSAAQRRGLSTNSKYLPKGKLLGAAIQEEKQQLATQAVPSQSGPGQLRIPNPEPPPGHVVSLCFIEEAK